MAADLFNTLLAAANLALNPIASDSNILLTNLPPTLPIPTTMTTNNGLEFPCTAEGIKLLGSPLGQPTFCKDLSRFPFDSPSLKNRIGSRATQRLSILASMFEIFHLQCQHPNQLFAEDDGPVHY